MQLTALALHPQAARGVTTAAPLDDDEVPGFELKAGPPGSVRPACAGGTDITLGALVSVHSTRHLHSSRL